MGKGAQDKQRTRVDYNQQGTLDRRNELIPMLQNQQAAAQNNFNQAAASGSRDYEDIMGRYRGLADQNQDPITYNRSNELNSAFGGYQNFADTGGFSADDITNMRARGISPIRAVYANAMNDLARQKNIAGGYMPNLPAATRSMTRSLSGQLADQVQNVNAQLAQQIQQGKMFGTEGLGRLGVQDLQLGQQAKLANAQQARDRAAVLSGMGSLYSSAPGQAQMFGNQLQNATGNLLNQENAFMNQGNQIAGQYAQAQMMPTAFQSGLQNVGQIANIGAGIAAPFMMPGMPPLSTSSMSGIGDINSGLYNLPGMSQQNSPYS